MKSVAVFVLLGILPMLFLTADAGPAIIGAPLSDLIISGMDESNTLKSDSQVTISAKYVVNQPNTQFVILYQVTNEEGQVVLLNWVEGFQKNLTAEPPSYVCGDDICFDKWASSSDSYVCGDKICYGGDFGSNVVETSWTPISPGHYEVVVFAWVSVDNPSALSPPLWTEVIVV